MVRNAAAAAAHKRRRPQAPQPASAAAAAPCGGALCSTVGAACNEQLLMLLTRTLLLLLTPPPLLLLLTTTSSPRLSMRARTAMYDAEGIAVERVEYSDNKRVVDLIGGAPQGLLSMLTEECLFPKGTDTSYLGKLNSAFKRHEAFVELKTSPNEFAVRHFAGEVTYAVDAFLEKNKDPISQVGRLEQASHLQ